MSDIVMSANGLVAWEADTGEGSRCLFEAGCLLTFSTFRMGTYSRWGLIGGWVSIRINTVSLEPLLILRLKECKLSTKMCQTDLNVMFSTSMSATILLKMVLVWRSIFRDCQHDKCYIQRTILFQPLRKKLGNKSLVLKILVFQQGLWLFAGPQSLLLDIL